MMFENLWEIRFPPHLMSLFSLDRGEDLFSTFQRLYVLAHHCDVLAGLCVWMFPHHLMVLNSVYPSLLYSLPPASINLSRPLNTDSASKNILTASRHHIFLRFLVLSRFFLGGIAKYIFFADHQALVGTLLWRSVKSLLNILRGGFLVYLHRHSLKAGENKFLNLKYIPTFTKLPSKRLFYSHGSCYRYHVDAWITRVIYT